MSKRCTTPSFVLEVPLVVTPDDERVLLARLEAGRRLYNAVCRRRRETGANLPT